MMFYFDYVLGKHRNAKRSDDGRDCYLPPPGGKRLQPNLSLSVKMPPIQDLSAATKVEGPI